MSDPVTAISPGAPVPARPGTARSRLRYGYPPRAQLRPGVAAMFLSFDEPEAEANYRRACSVLGTVGRVHGVAGIGAAHRAAARLAGTPVVVVIDADTWLYPSFGRALADAEIDDTRVHYWEAQNPLTSRPAGFGSVKALPARAMLDAPECFGADHSLYVARRARRPFTRDTRPHCETRFNAAATTAWRGAYREVAKTVLRLRERHDEKSFGDLSAWIACDVGGRNGSWARLGAIDAIGDAHGACPRTLERSINDFARLDARAMKVVNLTQRSLERTIAREMPRVRRRIAALCAAPRGKACA